MLIQCAEKQFIWPKCIFSVQKSDLFNSNSYFVFCSFPIQTFDTSVFSLDHFIFFLPFFIYFVFPSSWFSLHFLFFSSRSIFLYFSLSLSLKHFIFLFFFLISLSFRWLTLFTFFFFPSFILSFYISVFSVFCITLSFSLLSTFSNPIYCTFEFGHKAHNLLGFTTHFYLQYIHWLGLFPY